EINIYTGGIGATVSVYTQNGDPSKYRMMAEVNCKVLHSNLEHAMRLIGEILTTTKWSSKDRILEVLEEERAAMRADLPASGHATAAVRASSGFSETALIMDCVNGVNAYHTLDEVCGLLEKGEADEFLSVLEEMARYIFRADHLMLDCTADENSLEEICAGTGTVAGSFLKGKTPEEDLKEYGAAFRVEPVKVKEGFTTSGQVQYVCRAGNYGNKGCAYTGALRVLRVILGYDYLWQNVRVKGGAYGCMSSFSRDGSAYFVSYRDPHLAQTIRTFEEAPAYIRQFDADERTMTKYIIGAVSALDHPMSPSTYGKYSLAGYMTGFDEKKLQRERDQLLDCRPEDIRALAAHIEAFLSEDALCVVGNAEKLRAESDRFERMEKLQ
ncbi:MAG: insulinase family protein, partial [Lachnospiraceae bacterium]